LHQTARIVNGVHFRRHDPDDGLPYANLKRLCEDLGIAYESQAQKLHAARWATITNIVTVGLDGKQRGMLFISADTIPMWLATINANKVARWAVVPSRDQSWGCSPRFH
jgi:hypothetical protein